MLVSNGEPGMVRYLKKLAKDHQRCLWHLPYELPSILAYQDGLTLNEAREYKSDLESIIEVRLPEEDFKEVPLEDKLELEKQTWETEKR